MHLLDGSVTSLLGSADLIGVFAATAHFYGERVVGDGALDVDADVEFDEIPLLKDHLPLQPLRRLERGVGGVVRSHLIDGDGYGEGGVPSVTLDEALRGVDDLVPGLAGCDLALDSLDGPASDVAGISPLLQVSFLNHVRISSVLTTPSLNTSVSLNWVEPQTEYHAINVLGAPPGHTPDTLDTPSPVADRRRVASSQSETGSSPLLLALLAVSGPVIASSSLATG